MNTDVEQMIVDRMQRLACLGLEGQPAAELITATGRVWIERLSRFHPNRLRMAFDSIEATASRWPTPGNIIAALPAYEHTYLPPPAPPERQIAVDPEQAAKAKARIDRVITRCADLLKIRGDATE